MLRDLGVPLVRISALLDGSGADRRQELEERRSALTEKIRHRQQVAREVDDLLLADQQGPLLHGADPREVLGPDWNPDWTRQAHERWGDGAQWAEYAERSSRRSPQEWADLTASVRDAITDLGEAKRGGAAPCGPSAADLAERHRHLMSEFFHCTLSMHVVLGRMIVSEPSRRESYDSVEPGLAAWLSEAIDAVAGRAGIDPDTATWE